MSAVAAVDDLCSPAERARLEALAGAIEGVRAAARARARPERGVHSAGPADRPLDWPLLAEAAGESLRLLRQARLVPAQQAALLGKQLGDPGTLQRLVAWGSGQAGSPPFEGAALAWEVVRLVLPAFLQTGDAVSEPEGGGTCPECGGAAEFAFLGQGAGARTLTCAVCETAWRFDRVQCPFCGSLDHRALHYLAGGPRGYAIRVCDACGTYLKTVDRRQRPGSESPLLLRMLSVEMDLSAQAAGYHRGETRALAAA